MLKSYFVTPKELSDAISNQTSNGETTSRIIPVCAAWFLPNDPQKRTGRQVFDEKRIPNARFFDLDAIKDHDSQYPHMLPTTEVFADAMADLGIEKRDTVVVYDTHELGLFSAPRVAWTFKTFGHGGGVHILNNFRTWIEEGHPTESGQQTQSYDKTKYPTPDLHPDMVASFRMVKAIASNRAKQEDEEAQVIDLRSPGRFSGAEPEPRPGLPSGHMPGSINLPLPELLDPQSKTLLPTEDLIRVFESKGVDPTKPIITTCGTGVMAAALDAALDATDFGSADNRKVYDGSWT